MFKRTVRCIDCGFLAKRHEEIVGSGANASVDRVWKVSPLAHWQRQQVALLKLPETIDVRCFRDRYDLIVETAEVSFDSQRHGEKMERNDALVSVLQRERDCEWFERYRLGLSFDAHIDVQERRREWRRTAAVALLASIVGGVLAMIPSVIAVLSR